MAEPIKEKDEIQEATEVIETPVEEVVEKKEEAPVEETVETVETVETEATKEEVVTETKKMTDADSFITKMEGFIMFFVVLVMLIICTLTMNTAFNRVENATVDSVSELKAEIEELQLQVTSLKAELEYANPGIKGETDVDEMAFDTRPFLGVAFAAEEETNALGLKIAHVYEGSPAEDAGIKVGDIIVSIDGVKTIVFDDLDAVISSHVAGDKVVVELATVTENGIDCVGVEAILSYRGNFDLE